VKRTPFHSKSKYRPVAETRAMRAYREAHPMCEACKREPTRDTHHIVSEKTGGPSEDWNFLGLCLFCHVPGFHTLGWLRFSDHYPHLAPKIAGARLRMGRSLKGAS